MIFGKTARITSIKILVRFTGIWLISVASSVDARINFIHPDHLGTPIAMTNEQGQITWRAEYSPFGKAVIDPTSTEELNLRLPGQYYDEETGLHYNYFRDYDPETGRYIQSDPIGLDGGINTYAYALMNPVRFVDRFGLWVKRCARELGNPNNPAMAPRLNPLRHDYLSVSGNILSFQAGTGNGWRDMFWSQGWIDERNEHPDNPKCVMVCEDENFDKYVFQARLDIGAPTYCIIPGVPGASNCQTWASDVLDLAKKNYLENEDCPKCFKGTSGGDWRFNPNFGRAL